MNATSDRPSLDRQLPIATISSDSANQKRVWLLLYGEGGRWTPAEISLKLRMLPKTVTWVLREMVERGYLVRTDTVTPEDTPLAKYGVGRMCKVPRGVTVDEMWVVLQMGGAKPPPKIDDRSQS